MSRRGARNFLLLILGSFAFVWGLSLLGALKPFELKIQDYLFRHRYRLSGLLDVSPYVVHLDIDDVSMKTLGTSVERGAWYRKIIDILADCDAGAVIFDIVFAASDQKGAYDEIVAATRESGAVYYPVILQKRQAGESLSTDDVGFPSNLIWHVNVVRPGRVPEATVMLSTAAELLGVARGVGHITCNPDKQDGVRRRFPLFFKYKDGYIPGISFRAVCDYLHVSPETIDVAFGEYCLLPDAQFPDGRTKDIRIPIDRQGRMIINYAGKWREEEKTYFAHYSLADLFDTAEDDEAFDTLIDELEERLVIVANVSGGLDIGPVPLDDAYTLPGIHSNLVSAILTGQFVDEWGLGGKLAIDGVLVLLLLLLACRCRASVFAVSVGVLSVLCWVGGAALFLTHSVLTDTMHPSVAMLLSLVTVNVYKFLLEEKSKAALRASVEHYFAPTLLDKILASPAILEAREKKRITILFSDIKGFTAWSSSREPEEIHETLNEYFEHMARIVFKYDGTIDKYIGDGLMAFFGDPIEHEDHPLRAVKAAIEMQTRVRELRARWEPEGRMAIQIRIGINTGEVVVGNMGSAQRVDYTAIGAHVNLAQRLESGAPVGGILISDSVRDAIKDRAETNPAGTIEAKGFADPIPVHEVVVG